MIFLDKITKLKPPVSKDPNTYAVKEIKKNSNHLIGINFNREIAILFDATKPYSKGDALEYIQLVHNQKCTVKEDKKEKNKNYSVLKCSIDNKKLRYLIVNNCYDS